MIPISNEGRAMICGGAPGGSLLKSVNRGVYGVGMVSLAATSAITNIANSIRELIIGPQEAAQRRGHLSDAIRPTFRLASNYWTSSVAYGMPWYY